MVEEAWRSILLTHMTQDPRNPLWTDLFIYRYGRLPPLRKFLSHVDVGCPDLDTMIRGPPPESRPEPTIRMSAT